MSGVDILTEVQRDMRFIGWEGDSASGFNVKKDAEGNIIARAHDATWIEDVEECTARAERLAIVRELERREQERGR